MTKFDAAVVEKLPDGWSTELVIYKPRNGHQKWGVQIVDPRNVRSVHEPMATMNVKSFELLVGIPLYLGGYVAWHSLRTVVCMAVTAISSFSYLFKGRPKEFFTQLFWNTLDVLGEGIWTVARSPFFALAMEVAALYAVFQPLKGRTWIGAVEKEWHQKGREANITYVDPKKDPWFLAKALGDPKFSKTFFLAFCMQPLGTIHDDHILSHVKLEPGSKLPTDVGLIPAQKSSSPLPETRR